MNRKWIAGAATFAVMACSGMSIHAVGTQAQSTKPGTMPGTMKGPEIEGRVRDVRGEQITLNDGTTLTVPKSQAKLGELKAGAKIKATYEERDGKKIVTSLQVTEGPQTGGATK
jgi:Cu/Ag efflux protein CusF